MSKENLGYNPVEVPDMKGYFFVPNFTKYAMNSDGVCINVRTGQKIRWVIHGGYLKITAMNDLGAYSAFSLHHSKMVLFGNPPPNYKSLCIDHIDGNRLNCEMENMEWVTHKENKRRSLILKDKLYNLSIEVKNTDTGKVKVYSSAHAAGKAMGIHPTTILRYLTRRDFVSCTRNNLYRYTGDKRRQWEKAKVRGTLQNTKKQVLVMDIRSGNFTLFESVGKCARALGLESKQCSALCKKSNNCPTVNHIFRFKISANVLDHDWPDFDLLEVKALTDAVRVHTLYRAIKDDDEKVFSNAKGLMDYLKVDVSTLYKKMKSDSKVKGYRIITRRLR